MFIGINYDGVFFTLDETQKGIRQGEQNYPMNIDPGHSNPINDNEIWVDLGVCMINSRAYEEAVFYFDKVLELDPENWESVNFKADSLMCLGREEEAMECFDIALRNNPLNYYLWASKEEFMDVYFNGDSLTNEDEL